MALIVGRALCVAAALLCCDAMAQHTAARTDELKAAYLLNFIKFVEWPAHTRDTLTICVVGAEGVAKVLGQAVQAKKNSGGRSLAVLSLTGNVVTDACDVLFIDARAAALDQRLLRDQAAKPLLTVSDAYKFVEHGGMIELFTEGNRLRFNINMDTAARSGLQISASLLQLAVVVVKPKSAP